MICFKYYRRHLFIKSEPVVNLFVQMLESRLHNTVAEECLYKKVVLEFLKSYRDLLQNKSYIIVSYMHNNHSSTKFLKV